MPRNIINLGRPIRTSNSVARNFLGDVMNEQMLVTLSHPFENMLVNLNHFIKDQSEIKKHLKPTWTLDST